MKVTAKDRIKRIEEMDCSITKIAKMSTWKFFAGWTAETCGHCKATVNVTISAGWFCPCGDYNIMSWNSHQIPHSHPVYGPSQKKLRVGYSLVKLKSSLDLELEFKEYA